MLDNAVEEQTASDTGLTASIVLALISFATACIYAVSVRFCNCACSIKDIFVTRAPTLFKKQSFYSKTTRKLLDAYAPSKIRKQNTTSSSRDVTAGFDKGKPSPRQSVMPTSPPASPPDEDNGRKTPDPEVEQRQANGEGTASDEFCARNAELDFPMVPPSLSDVPADTAHTRRRRHRHRRQSAASDAPDELLARCANPLPKVEQAQEEEVLEPDLEGMYEEMLHMPSRSSSRAGSRESTPMRSRPSSEESQASVTIRRITLVVLVSGGR